ncbi:DUF1292 domain-containing protein [Lihuaxuella thermophila]|uniref:DUF1292 domain-containing protein n=1 Tax=Lihuaxuella thermophila TaxID=1173111 RepID=A0A1H8AV46_9BACL|nr:DUF1292 domain-containing protein [Lihuaxuella thermophila]SEM73377.1 Protein of unknown function [Lihuaxuella thermophila]
MNHANEPEAKEVYILRNQSSPDQLFLRSELDGKLEQYRILNEVEVDGQHYAIMCKEKDYPDDAFLFRIHQNRAEEIEDEAEWERIADAVDYLLYSNDT